MYWPAALLDDVLDIPSIDVLSAAPFQPMFGYYTANPNPVAYLPQLGSGLTPDMVSLWLCPAVERNTIVTSVLQRDPLLSVIDWRTCIINLFDELQKANPRMISCRCSSAYDVSC